MPVQESVKKVLREQALPPHPPKTKTNLATVCPINSQNEILKSFPNRWKSDSGPPTGYQKYAKIVSGVQKWRSHAYQHIGFEYPT